ncbi:hypothetical protein KOW79_007173 [Hemibagrus wyckioides]|uniref:G-protein coupled receptors family 1 profile domain-containing protein n=1 Tax=Hemibagrus wyckioides TaxID=337641 RepID=A0A9D3SRE8_9TELE|nr:hypothetical protein KOW79_007173 [Hemibagrus wyckioides]
MGPSDPANVTSDIPNEEKEYTDWYQNSLGNYSMGSHKPVFVDDITKHLSVQIALITAYSLIIILGLVADLMVDTMCLPFTLAYTLLDEWKFGAVMCHMVPYAQALSVHVSILTLTVIALERYRCIVFHMGQRLSRCASFVIISLTWSFSAILAGPLAIFREYRYEEIAYINLRIAVCSEKWPHGTNRDAIIYSFSMLLLQYVLPLGIISYAYVCIWVKLKNHVSPSNRNDGITRRKKTTKMLALVVVVFAVCWLPFHVFQLASDLDLVLKFKEYKLLYTLFHIVAMCSTFTNPLLYGWMNKNYRNGFIMFFRCEHKPDTIHPEGSFRTRTLRGLILYNNGHPATAV